MRFWLEYLRIVACFCLLIGAGFWAKEQVLSREVMSVISDGMMTDVRDTAKREILANALSTNVLDEYIDKMETYAPSLNEFIARIAASGSPEQFWQAICSPLSGNSSQYVFRASFGLPNSRDDQSLFSELSVRYGTLHKGNNSTFIQSHPIGYLNEVELNKFASRDEAVICKGGMFSSDNEAAKVAKFFLDGVSETTFLQIKDGLVEEFNGVFDKANNDLQDAIASKETISAQTDRAFERATVGLEVSIVYLLRSVGVMAAVVFSMVFVVKTMFADINLIRGVKRLNCFRKMANDEGVEDIVSFLEKLNEIDRGR
ncbi:MULTISPECIES: hypothetical protein [Thalassospira]|uniref:Uncharacterized protein n=2 Tax=Thalassospira tepidiphila TaxID=393657 RepID=A0A853L3W9_9PROT|nr:MULTISPECIES: hypothetical protein [Thalassospira]MBO6578855.1 hypothetical protein [Thalassospira sp.]MBO6816838.1 hypothetical protein [Thalassospira sp.]MBO6889044.1 hypothetical protein [Thalassospira sp.]NJB74299.1 hypothetical protein [Thalassospira tepidiphila]OAZ11566.1 hypothetical protein TH4_00270 [Thalassospira tepidiphila MCCC 1A03514]